MLFCPFPVRRSEAAGATHLPSPPEDSHSLDTPPSRAATATAGATGGDPSMGGSSSRPGSAHSAPMLDVSIDRHYEFDARTPTDDLLDPEDIRQALPRQWNRPYLG